MGGGGQNLSLNPEDSNPPILLYYYKNVPNLGDLLNVVLCEEFFKQPIYYCGNFNFNTAIFIGSILQNFLASPSNRTFCNIPLKVWGSGFIMPPSTQESFTRPLEVYALRGLKTKERLEHIFQTKLTGIALGDPGLLASHLINTNEIPKKYEVGIIPHYIEKNSENFKTLQKAIPNSVLLDVQKPVLETLSAMAECETILSSAMHGLIISDGLGIPNLRIKASKRLAEDTNWKFEDYYSVYGITPYSFDIQKGLGEILKFADFMPLFIKEHYKIPQEKINKIKKNLIATFPYRKFSFKDAYCRMRLHKESWF